MTWLFIAGKFLQRHWKVAVSLGTLLLIFWAVNTWLERECVRCQEQVRREYERLLQAERDKVRAQEKQWQTLIHEVERENQTRLQELEAKYRGAVERIGPVRLCPPADRSGTGVPRDPFAATVDHAAPGDDRLPGSVGGRDIGPGLVRIARAAEAQTTRLIACQSYVRTLERNR